MQKSPAKKPTQNEMQNHRWFAEHVSTSLAELVQILLEENKNLREENRNLMERWARAIKKVDE